MKRGTRQYGFTLIEAMIAVVILAAGATAISVSFATAASVQTEANRKILASRLAADLMEEIVSTSYSSILATYPAGLTLTAEDMGNTDDIYVGLTCSVIANTTIEVSDGGTTVHLIHTTVSASHNGREITRLATLIGEKTPQ